MNTKELLLIELNNKRIIAEDLANTLPINSEAWKIQYNLVFKLIKDINSLQGY